MNDAANESGFGLAQIKREGESIPFDRAPPGPPDSWLDRFKWRMRRLRIRLRHIADAITERDTGF